MLKCIQPGCGRTGDDIGQCGSTRLCPPIIDPATGVTEVQTAGLDIVIECIPCGITRAYSTASFMKTAGQHGRLCNGVIDQCQARARTLPAEEPKADFKPTVVKRAPKAE